MVANNPCHSNRSYITGKHTYINCTITANMFHGMRKKLASRFTNGLYTTLLPFPLPSPLSPLLLSPSLFHLPSPLSPLLLSRSLFFCRWWASNGDHHHTRHLHRPTGPVYGGNRGPSHWDTADRKTRAPRRTRRYNDSNLDCVVCKTPQDACSNSTLYTLYFVNLVNTESIVKKILR